MNTPCNCCKKPTENHLVLICSICRNAFSNTCVGISSTEVRFIDSKKSISCSCKNCESIGSDIASLKTVIVSLQNEIKVLKVQANRNKSGNLDEQAWEELFLEFKDRQERKSNIMLYGLPEQPSNTPRYQRVAHENDEVHSVIRSIKPDVSDSVKIQRMGKFMANSNYFL
ncbi:hypothetical protein HHI36_009604 [Cryptolaemus montrouzieri]|uniref:Zinc finger PHD-type domain-containing protein n=1 Tax=Cryptolaemus montrouzieri TaxID=559131 RepID=A0ABD2MGD7_9CUCU